MTNTTTKKTVLKRVRVVPAPILTKVTNLEYFQEAGVVWMGEQFQALFLGLEIGNTDPVELVVHELPEKMLDKEILAELGDKAELTVSQFKAFLAGNRKSKEWFILYLRGKDGNLWAVGASWGAYGDGWGVDANSIDNPLEWSAGSQVVSRN